MLNSENKCKELVAHSGAGARAPAPQPFRNCGGKKSFFGSEEIELNGLLVVPAESKKRSFQWKTVLNSRNSHSLSNSRPDNNV